MIEAIAFVVMLLLLTTEMQQPLCLNRVAVVAHLLNLAVTRRMTKMAGRLHTAVYR